MQYTIVSLQVHVNVLEHVVRPKNKCLVSQALFFQNEGGRADFFFYSSKFFLFIFSPKFHHNEDFIGFK